MQRWRRLVVGLCLLAGGLFSEVSAQVRVDGYYRRNGTYVQPHMRNAPDSNPYNNWSFPGNTNPYTGERATGRIDTYLQDRHYTPQPSRLNELTPLPGLQPLPGLRPLGQ